MIQLSTSHESSSIQGTNQGAPSGASPDWLFQAQKIVAYPEDFGMTRIEVTRLSHMLAERRQPTR
jgi:hypothetical protein